MIIFLAVLSSIVLILYIVSLFLNISWEIEKQEEWRKQVKKREEYQKFWEADNRE